VTDFVTEIKNDLHALWARLSAEGHALAASVEAMYEKALNAAETAEKTTLGRLALGSDVNLERSLRVGDRLGGHMLSGHVDAVAKIASVEEQGEAWLVRVGFGQEQARFLAQKGSVTLDGVSLTVNDVSGLSLGVMLIPHTREVTSLKHWRPGSEVNLEVDLVARYLARYFEVTGQKPAVADDARFALALERAGYK